MHDEISYADRVKKSEDKALTLKLIVAGIVIVAIVLAGFGIRHLLRGDVRAAQATTFVLTNMTYGEIIDGALNRTRWSTFTGTNMRSVVEINGRTPDNERVVIQMQRTPSIRGGEWEWQIVYMEIDGRSLSADRVANWIMNAASR